MKVFCDNLFCKFSDIDGNCTLDNSIRLVTKAEKDKPNNLDCQSFEEDE